MTIFLDKKRKINEEIQKGKSMMKGMKSVWDIGLALKVVQEVALSKISRRISKTGGIFGNSSTYFSELAVLVTPSFEELFCFVNV